MEESTQFEEAPWDEVFSYENVKMVVSKEVLIGILKEAGYKIDSDGFILDKAGKKVFANDEREIKVDELGAIGSGSRVLIRKNFASLSDYLATKK